VPPGLGRRSNPGSAVRSGARRPPLSFVPQLPANVVSPSTLPTGSLPPGHFPLSWLPSDRSTMPSNSGACSCETVLQAMILAVVKKYQRLGCLLRLRDLVAHRNARLCPVGTVPDQIADCVRQGVVPIRQGIHSEWPNAVLVHEVADWATQTAKRWLKVADKLIPLVC